MVQGRGCQKDHLESHSEESLTKVLALSKDDGTEVGKMPKAVFEDNLGSSPPGGEWARPRSHPNGCSALPLSTTEAFRRPHWPWYW